MEGGGSTVPPRGSSVKGGGNVGIKMDTLNERIRFFLLSTRK
jgi:hypothetical protein